VTDYFVKNGGDGTGTTTDPGTSGDWSASFDSIDVALDTAGGNDTIFFSDGHNKLFTSAINWLSTATLGNGVELTCVEDLDTSVSSVGGFEGSSAVAHTKILDEEMYVWGLNFKSAADIQFTAGKQNSTFDNCDLWVGSDAANGRRLHFTDTNFGSSVLIKNSTIRYSHVGQGLGLSRLKNIHFINCKLNTSGTNINTLIITYSSGGGIITHEHCDLSKVTVNLAAAMTTSVEAITAKFFRCKLASGVSLSPTMVLNTHKLIAEACDVGDGFHFFHYASFNGTTEEETSIYRTLGAEWKTGSHFSAEMISNASASFDNPLIFKLSVTNIDTSEFTTNVIVKAHFLIEAGAALANNELAIKAVYNDGADNALGATMSDKPNPLSTGTAADSESSLWTNPPATNTQFSRSLTLPKGVTAGDIASGIVEIHVILMKASTTLFACPQPDFS
jgi:hypothetical protein